MAAIAKRVVTPFIAPRPIMFEGGTTTLQPQFTLHGDTENSGLRSRNRVLCRHGSGYCEEGSVSLRVRALLADRSRVRLPIRLPAAHEMGTERVLPSRSGQEGKLLGESREQQGALLLPQ